MARLDAAQRPTRLPQHHNGDIKLQENQPRMQIMTTPDSREAAQHFKAPCQGSKQTASSQCRRQPCSCITLAGCSLHALCYHLGAMQLAPAHDITARCYGNECEVTSLLHTQRWGMGRIRDNRV